MIDLPISPTLLRVVRVFRIGRILRLIKVSYLILNALNFLLSLVHNNIYFSVHLHFYNITLYFFRPLKA